jgi:hypothetical protein
MSDSPWNAYGRLPLGANSNDQSDKTDPVAGVISDVMRGREQVDKYLNAMVREYFEIQSGSTGYRSIIADALAPSDRPETIEERLERLARTARARRPGIKSRTPRPPRSR